MTIFGLTMASIFKGINPESNTQSQIPLNLRKILKESYNQLFSCQFWYKFSWLRILTKCSILQNVFCPGIQLN